ncbi:sirohydrochlorin chelatase [Cellulomonas chengniuliangii]|uniref:Sirohydrochlorin chelatase n=1 Tax=Cellulomonas chengniuliangii TaxID=2968084 RepID=A0ABY5L299_9CELL|nr:CbiX/SirB N-terminal domain-containing protein [Cellulomonas chengniuliangii]MCC2308218.1 sirohydrochlorin chelatase [Cellulomonas chengniuliangii]UUI76936.1 sirohydrochlorin chelatase [Cellulomonas chengniuliangii]
MLVACSHGTDDVRGRHAIRGLVASVRAARPGLDVREAFVDVQEPRVDSVVRAASDEGRDVVVVPLLLSAGFHVHVDIAAAVAAPRAVAAHALGPDPRLVEVLARRLRGAGAGAGDAVVLAAAGSSDPRAARDVEAVVARLRSAWTAGPVTVGYGAGCAPRVPEAVAAARLAGARRVVLASYLLAPGYFHGRLLEAGADVVAAPLVGDGALVDVVLDRFDEASRALPTREPG